MSTDRPVGCDSRRSHTVARRMPDSLVTCPARRGQARPPPYRGGRRRGSRASGGPDGIGSVTGECGSGPRRRARPQKRNVAGELHDRTHSWPPAAHQQVHTGHLPMLTLEYRDLSCRSLRLACHEADQLTLRPLVDSYPPVTEALTRPGSFRPPRPRGWPAPCRGGGSRATGRPVHGRAARTGRRSCGWLDQGRTSCGSA